jgi:hypothetical protein
VTKNILPHMGGILQACASIFTAKIVVVWISILIRYLSFSDKILRKFRNLNSIFKGQYLLINKEPLSGPALDDFLSSMKFRKF